MRAAVRYHEVLGDGGDSLSQGGVPGNVNPEEDLLGGVHGGDPVPPLSTRRAAPQSCLIDPYNFPG